MRIPRKSAGRNAQAGKNLIADCTGADA